MSISLSFAPSDFLFQVVCKDRTRRRFLSFEFLIPTLHHVK